MEIKLKDLLQIPEFTALNCPDDQRQIKTIYCCDLLSMAMGRAPESSAWITVMGNQNSIAVASLTDVACLILAEDVPIQEDALKKAQENDISIFSTNLPAYEAARKIGALLDD